MRARTMVYLDAEELRALRREARSRGISLAELLRRLVKQHLESREGIAPPEPAVYLKIVALGSSGRHDVSERHDHYLAEAIRR